MLCTSIMTSFNIQTYGHEAFSKGTILKMTFRNPAGNSCGLAAGFVANYGVQTHLSWL